MLAVAAAVNPSEILSGGQGYLSYGPIGLAGLLFVLVLTTVLIRNVDPARERTLKLVLVLGVACFFAALVSQHFTPLPPMPSPPPDFTKQRAVLASVLTDLTSAQPMLREITGYASDGGACSGGGHGVPMPHGSDVVARSSSVLSKIGSAHSFIQTVRDSLPYKE